MNHEHFNDDHERTEPELHPKIWVGSLADYNNGHLHGCWMDAAREASDLYADVQAMLAQSDEEGAEEWGIFDHDEFGGVRIDEYESLETVAAIAKGIAQHGAPFAAWVELVGKDEVNDEQAFLDAFLGTFVSPAEFAETLWDDLGFGGYLDKAIPADLRYYVQPDFEQWARDMEASGEVEFVEVEGRFWVFRD